MNTPASTPAASGCWSPVAASASLPPGQVMPLQLEGQRLALWRSETGHLAAWEDRCPHRGMRLSFGAVQRDRLICPYHGWAFDEGGQCRHIPAHASQPPVAAARMRVFNVHEAGGYIWVSLSDTAFQGQVEIEALTLQPLRSLYVERDEDDILAALAAQGAVREDLPAIAPLLRLRQAVIFVQRTGVEGCMLHAAAAGEASAAQRLDINEWLTEFGLALSAPAMEVRAA